MTKPPEGGLSPKEHLAKPDGQRVSREISLPQTLATLRSGAFENGKLS